MLFPRLPAFHAILMAAAFSAFPGTAFAQAQEGSPPVLLAAHRGAPFLNLRDGRPVQTSYHGDSASARALQANQATPLALASADFDEDGAPDLASGFASPDGAGLVAIHRGNEAALWPYGAALRNGEPPPFHPEARVFALPEQPDFLGAGDFDADGHWDIVAARRGSRALYLLPGDGHGGFGAPQRIDLPAGVTALCTGEVNRRSTPPSTRARRRARQP